MAGMNMKLSERCGARCRLGCAHLVFESDGPTVEFLSCCTFGARTDRMSGQLTEIVRRHTNVPAFFVNNKLAKANL